MSVATVNISFNADLLSQIDKIAKEEVRSRSELIREASRMYIERKNKWRSIFAYGQNIASRNNLLQKDITNEIKAHRKKK